MADATNFSTRIDDADKRSLSKILHTPFDHDQVIRNVSDQGFIRAHILTELTLSIVNTGAATDDDLKNEVLSAFAVARSDFFNSTIKTDVMDNQVLLGILFNVDHTTTSPDTDKGDVQIELGIGHRTGDAPSSVAAKSTLSKSIVKFLSEIIVEAAGIKTEPYSEPVFEPLASPIVVGKNDSVKEYWSIFGKIQRVTGKESRAKLAHTVVTTYTLKVNAWAILADVNLVNSINARAPRELLQALGLSN